MENDKLAVFAEAHIDLHGPHAQADTRLHCRHRVLGRGCPAAAMRDNEHRAIVHNFKIRFYLGEVRAGGISGHRARTQQERRGQPEQALSSCGHQSMLSAQSADCCSGGAKHALLGRQRGLLPSGSETE